MQYSFVPERGGGDTNLGGAADVVVLHLHNLSKLEDVAVDFVMVASPPMALRLEDSLQILRVLVVQFTVFITVKGDFEPASLRYYKKNDRNKFVRYNRGGMDTNDMHMRHIPG